MGKSGSRPNIWFIFLGFLAAVLFLQFRDFNAFETIDKVIAVVIGLILSYGTITYVSWESRNKSVPTSRRNFIGVKFNPIMYQRGIVSNPSKPSGTTYSRYSYKEYKTGDSGYKIRMFFEIFAVIIFNLIMWAFIIAHYFLGYLR